MRVVHSKGCIGYFKRARHIPRAFRHHEIPDDLLIFGYVVGSVGCFFGGNRDSTKRNCLLMFIFSETRRAYRSGGGFS